MEENKQLVWKYSIWVVGNATGVGEQASLELILTPFLGKRELMQGPQHSQRPGSRLFFSSTESHREPRCEELLFSVIPRTGQGEQIRICANLAMHLILWILDPI